MPAWVPPTSSKTVVFPLNEQYNTYYTEFYESSMTNNQVSLQQINNFISDINAEYKLYKKKVDKQYWKASFFGMLLSLALLLDIMMLVAPSSDDFLGLFTNGEVVILSWFLLFSIHKLYGYLCDCKLGTDVLSELKDKCQDLLDEQNEILRSRNLKWLPPVEFPTWIELTKDMKKPNKNLKVAAQQPIPQTTENLIIFPIQCYIFNQKLERLWRFSQDFFSPDMADGRISCQEVHDFLSEINACLRISYKGSFKVPFAVLICLSVELFGLLYVSNHFPDFLTTLQIITIAVISVIVSLVLYDRVTQREFQKRKALCKARCQTIVEKYNETLQTRGLRWQLPDQFSLWIELCKVPQNHDPNRELIDIPTENQELPINPGDEIEAGNQNHNRRFQNDRYAPLVEDEN